jgi:hypothetical protein
MGFFCVEKHSPFRDRPPLQAHTELTLLLFGLAFPWHARTVEKRDMTKSPASAKIHTRNIGGWGDLCPTFSLRTVVTDPGASTHPTTHICSTSCLRMPSGRQFACEFLMCPQSRTKKRSQSKTCADLVNLGHLRHLLKTKFTIEKINKIPHPHVLYITYNRNEPNFMFWVIAV